MKLFKNPFFYTSFLSLLALGLIIGSYVFGWTTPSTTPPGGNVTMSSSQWITSGSDIYYNLGKVGIGTTAPGELLHISGASHTRIRLNSTLANPSQGLEIMESGVAKAYIQRQESNKLAFYSGGGGGADLKMVILDTGNVGIGTTGPSSLLTVIGSWPQAYFTNQTGASYGVVIGNSGTGAEIGAHHWTGSVYDAWADLTLQKSGGNVGIGTTAPAAKLEVSGGGIKNRTNAGVITASASVWTTIDTNTGYTGVLYNVVVQNVGNAPDFRTYLVLFSGGYSGSNVTVVNSVGSGGSTITATFQGSGSTTGPYLLQINPSLGANVYVTKIITYN
jgi:hypothetical protein